MTRDQFEHAVRAAGAVLGVHEVLVIGSQALHAAVDRLPAEAIRSVEVDVGVLDGDADAPAGGLARPPGPIRVTGHEWGDGMVSGNARPVAVEGRRRP